MRIRIYFNLGEISDYSKMIALSFDEILNNLGGRNSKKIAEEELKKILYYIEKINNIIRVLEEEKKIINHCIEENKPLDIDIEIIFKVNEKLLNIVLKKIKRLIDLKLHKIYLN